jgi:hypothetical protein
VSSLVCLRLVVRDNEPCRLLRHWFCVRVIDLGWRR